MTIDIVYGTRPELIKLAVVIHHLKEIWGNQVRIISTGQHQEMLPSLEEWFGIRPEITLKVMKERQSIGHLSSLILAELSTLYASNRPDWVIVQGDTQTAFVGAQAAFYHGIKVAHIEAGLRTFDKKAPFPEEINRQLISKLADLHFCPSSISKSHLLNEGISESSIEVVGNTVLDALAFSKEKIDSLQIYPKELESYFTGEHSSSQIVLVTSHRRENIGEGLFQISEAIMELAVANPEVVFLVMLHPNPAVKETLLEKLGRKTFNVKFISPLSYPEFLALLNRSYFLLTDSGGLQEEAPSFGKPVLLLRTQTERPEGVLAGCVKVVGIAQEYIVRESQLLLDSEAAYREMVVDRNPFGDGQSALQIAKRLMNEQ